MLSPRLLQELRDYWRTSKRKPTTYLFPTQGSQPNDDVPMTSESVWDAVHEAATRAGLDKKHVHPHTLRHYAGFRTIPGEVNLEPIGGSLTKIFPA